MGERITLSWAELQNQSDQKKKKAALRAVRQKHGMSEVRAWIQTERLLTFCEFLLAGFLGPPVLV